MKVLGILWETQSARKPAFANILIEDACSISAINSEPTVNAQRSEEDEDMFSDSENDDDQYAFESDEETRRRVQALQRAQAEQAATAAQRPAGEQPAAFGGEIERSLPACQ